MNKEKLERLILNVAFCSASYTIAMRETGMSPNKLMTLTLSDVSGCPISAYELRSLIINGTTTAIKEIDRVLT